MDAAAYERRRSLKRSRAQVDVLIGPRQPIRSMQTPDIKHLLKQKHPRSSSGHQNNNQGTPNRASDNYSPHTLLYSEQSSMG